MPPDPILADLDASQALSDLIDRLDADERCTMLRLNLDEGDGLDNPLVRILDALDRSIDRPVLFLQPLIETDADAARLLARLLTLGCEGAAIPRRRSSDRDDVGYLKRFLLTGEAVIAAHYCALPTAIAGLRAVLTDPTLDEAARVGAVLALDPRAAEWISHALAHGAHPDVPDRFYPAPNSAPDPGSFVVVDRDTNSILAMRRDREDAEVIAATLNAHPAEAAVLARLVGARTPAASTGNATAAERWRTAWQAFGRVSEPWRRTQGWPCDPWRASLREVA